MILVPGFRGRLVAESFLAGQVSRPDVHSAAHALATADKRWLQAVGPASSPRAILESALQPMLTALGFAAVEDARLVSGALVGGARANGDVVTIVVVPWGDRLDGYRRTAVTAARQQSSSWCLVFNGLTLRIVDARLLYSRRVADFDVALALDRDEGATAIGLLAHADALCASPGDPRSLRELIAASDRHAAGVCRSLRDGVLSASADVLGALAARERRPLANSVDSSFEQALTIVYRILFLLFAEARALVPLWHPVYRDSYSIQSLCDAAERSTACRGLWDALRAIARLAHAGCRAGDLRVTPFNGRLFAPSRTPLAERRDLDDDAARRAVLALSTRTTSDRAGRERIAYRDLGVEQLGAVYETLLDYEPRLVPTTATRRAPPVVTLETGSGVRKATGTFYTPAPIAESLVRRTLAPLVRDRPPDDILALRIVDPAMGSGAFLVAACRFLSSAYEEALVETGACHAGDVTEADRAGFRRLIAERCLYGVDLNPMAVQLARLSLWLATLAADRPLSFLDHRLICGDSLLGVWLTTLRKPPLPRHRTTRRPTLPLFDDDSAADALKDALPVRFSLETPSDTLDQVRAKERALTTLTANATGLSRWRRVADLWCAAWFGSRTTSVPPAAFGALADAVLTAQSVLPARTVSACITHAESVTRARRFLHWELEFPEVFFEANGRRRTPPGFDAVIGNPPWDMMRADAGDRAARDRSRDDVAAVVRFARDAGIYRAQIGGHANRYQLFVERALALTRDGGRIGLVLPSGLAADHGSAELRRLLLSRSDVDMIVGVENQRGIFPIHRSVRFLLVTTTVGSPTRRIGVRLGVQSTSELDTLDGEERPSSAVPLQLSTATLERLSGPSLAIPYLRSAVDLAICEKAAALFPALGSREGWQAMFGRELNATDDRAAFRTTGLGLPVVDGKHLEPFRVAVDRSERRIGAAAALRRLGPGRFDQPRLAYRDVAGPTNRLTLIAAILPRGCVSTHTVFCLRTPLALADQQLLCGLFNSLVVNYFVRLRVTTHVTTAIVEALPVPRAETAPATCHDIVMLTRRLQQHDDREALATLNAHVARLYQLTRAEFEHVAKTFPLVKAEERSRALALL